MVCVCVWHKIWPRSKTAQTTRALLLCFSPLCCQLSGTCRDGTYFQLPEPLRSAPPGTLGLLARPQFRAPKLRRQKPIVAEKAVSASATRSRTTIDPASSSRSLLLSPASACTSLCMHSPTSLGRLSPHPRPGVRVASSSDSWRAATDTSPPKRRAHYSRARRHLSAYRVSGPSRSRSALLTSFVTGRMSSSFRSISA